MNKKIAGRWVFASIAAAHIAGLMFVLWGDGHHHGALILGLVATAVGTLIWEGPP